MRRWTWLVGAVVVILLGVATCVYHFSFDGGDSKTDIAIWHVNELIRACKAYRHKPQANGKFPARLKDLAVPPEGMTAVIDGGETAIVDPWGKPYRYAVGDTEAGQVAYVWCELEVDGKLHGFGSRLTPDGKIRRFKIADD